MKWSIKKIMLLILLLVFWLSGCSSLRPFSPRHKYGKSYRIGRTYTTDTGSPMLTVYDMYILPAYRARYIFQPPYIYMSGSKLLEEMPPITPDQKWRVLYRRQNGNYIVHSKSYHKSLVLDIDPIGIEITPEGKLPDKEAWVHMDIPVKRAIQPLWELPDPELFEKAEGYAIEGSFKAELIYTGHMNNIITISYKEYVDDIEQPSFYQELQYDLNQGNEIELNSLKIKVLQVTETEIRFRVIDEGDPPWAERARDKKSGK